ncbi:branched-chain amino acid transport system ATP-binding protein [Nocardioides luteus]|uniref:ABC transporter ATP-binding protein n=1 Tax=Nocardioides luteus TaxID=1844 RepID=A0ABQ5SZF7_9ACTN|nr:ABC transporter ATP-binding protein [Nocardioides luteus]MDR7312586.1 branched-chain amino acid transport system ATP-binding protein [Nocardioides luteus]GGR46080.1 ABC transporter ATP-binding protein [Nocardioides luteus]GLJ68834.1 ABC transporter ATP-binding protein [Nocardioides luteus]
MIELKNLSARYGRVGVLREVDLHVAPGEVVALLGANGAGKTTLLHSVAGVHRAVTGAVLLDGDDVTALDAARRTRRGISLVPAGRQVFAELTVEQNLQVGLHGTRLSAAEQSKRFEQVLSMFPVLRDFASRPAGLLSGGQQQMLAIARALVRQPAYLLLDEPSLGLAPQIVEQILGVLETLTESGVGVLLAEQNAGAALGVSQRGVIVENGVIVRADSSDGLLNDPEVSNHYLGVEQEAVEVADRAVLPTSIFEPID